MTQKSLKVLASAGLVIGGLFGIAGTFAPEAMRGLLWGIDGVSLVVAGAILTLMHVRAGQDMAAAGFLVFTVGQGLILSIAPVANLADTVPSFGAGVALWAAGLALIGASNAFPLLIRLLGLLASLLFAIVAVRICLGAALLPTDQPLPSLGYPVLVATMFGWAWILMRDGRSAAAD